MALARMALRLAMGFTEYLPGWGPRLECLLSSPSPHGGEGTGAEERLLRPLRGLAMTGSGGQRARGPWRYTVAGALAHSSIS